MKKYMQKAALIIGYLLIIAIFTGLRMEQLFDVKELFLVIVGCIVLTLPYIPEKENNGRLVEIAGNNGMISAYMVSFVLILGKAWQTERGEPALWEILVSFRPILYGFSMLVLLKQPEPKNGKQERNGVIQTEAEDEKKLSEAGKIGKTKNEQGKVKIEEKKADEILKQKENVESRFETAGLTGREREVVRLVLAGLSNREIGEQLYIAESTVKKHLSNIFEKLDVKNREQLKQWFL